MSQSEKIKTLRAMTQVGLMDCKRALDESKGDIDQAVDFLRKVGQLKASKKAGRIAAQGRIVIACREDKKAAVLLEINSETDFLARDDSFSIFCEKVANQALIHEVSTQKALLNTPYEENGSETIEQARKNCIAKLGENIQIRRLNYLQTQGQIAYYLHGYSIGVLVEFVPSSEKSLDAARDIAMHVAAASPEYLMVSDVSEELLNKERSIYEAQDMQGKPEAVIQKIVEGKLDKFKKSISLLEQDFVKDSTLSVAQFAKQTHIEIKSFKRFQLGEGIEKKQENFAESVREQMKEASDKNA